MEVGKTKLRHESLCIIQSKFFEIRKMGSKHGYNLPTSPVVLLNALGFIGFKVVTVSGNSQVSQHM